MTERDWDAEMRKIDKQIASLPAQAATPARAAAPQPSTAPVAPARSETTTLGVMARLGLACVLGVAIMFWPYGAKCGFGLAGYLAAVSTLVVAGVWASVWSWKHRAAKAHAVSLVLVTWGLVLAAADVLPRVGYAKPTATHPANWVCP
ncbi:MAG TPA: hypothetical protein VGI97_10545 [Gemmatimonadaceae bacterium]|jgi:hypothetical protein